MNYLDKINKNCSISIDSANIELIKNFNISNVTTNPTLIFDFIKNKGLYYKELYKEYVTKCNKINNTKIINNKLIYIIYMIISRQILDKISGHLSLEINPKYCFNIKKSINEALSLIDFLFNNNIDINKILIKIPASWEGIQIAKILKKKKIKCNLTLIFSSLQAKLAAENDIYLISPFVGRILDWYINNNNLKIPYNIKLDPGVRLIKYISKEYKLNNYNTIIMAASFRNIDQIINLSSYCNILTISPKLLFKLINTKINKLKINNNNNYINIKINKINKNISKNKFLNIFNQNIMAYNNFKNGIDIFNIDYKSLFYYI